MRVELLSLATGELMVDVEGVSADGEAWPGAGG